MIAMGIDPGVPAPQNTLRNRKWRSFHREQSVIVLTSQCTQPVISPSLRLYSIQMPGIMKKIQLQGYRDDKAIPHHTMIDGEMWTRPARQM